MQDNNVGIGEEQKTNINNDLTKFWTTSWGGIFLKKNTFQKHFLYRY